MSLRDGLVLAAVNGLAVPITIAVFRTAWRRRQVPTALTSRVRRSNYLAAVLTESTTDDVTSLDVLAPRLMPAGEDDKQIAAIQAAWKDINIRGKVRILTLDSEESIRAGAQHVRDGIDVRIARRQLGEESLSYHLFRRDTAARCTAIVNHHHDMQDQPARLEGAVPAQVFQDHFRSSWENALPLQSVIAERVIERAGRPATVDAVLHALAEVTSSMALEKECVSRVLPHLGFRHSSSVVFIVGLPGAGKSYVRRKLEAELAQLGVENRGLTDYAFAYRDFLHSMIKLEPQSGGFEAVEGGAFMVKDEETLSPALRSLAQAVRESMTRTEVTLVEFARADLLSALQEFSDISDRAYILHVDAPADLRAQRLRRRAQPPESAVDGGLVTLTLSDDHLLPSTVERSLYGLDDVDQLAKSARWRSRIVRLQNDQDDKGRQVDDGIRSWVDRVLQPYRV